MSDPVTAPYMRLIAIDVLTSIYGLQPSVSGPNVKATSIANTGETPMGAYKDSRQSKFPANRSKE